MSMLYFELSQKSAELFVAIHDTFGTGEPPKLKGFLTSFAQACMSDGMSLFTVYGDPEQMRVPIEEAIRTYNNRMFLPIPLKVREAYNTLEREYKIAKKEQASQN